MPLKEEEAEDAYKAEVHVGGENGIEADPSAPDTRTIRMLNECDVIWRWSIWRIGKGN